MNLNIDNAKKIPNEQHCKPLDKSLVPVLSSIKRERKRPDLEFDWLEIYQFRKDKRPEDSSSTITKCTTMKT